VHEKRNCLQRLLLVLQALQALWLFVLEHSEKLLSA
jgi:hypothetical protein